MLADLQARDPTFTALVESDPAYKVLEVCAYREMLIRERVNTAAQAVMLAHARGADLDQLGALLGTECLALDPGNPDEGVAPTMESDENFRRRIQLAPEGFSVAVPEGAYVFHALSADTDVLDASATSPAAGEVVVSILSRMGNGAASAALLDHVAQMLASDDGSRHGAVGRDRAVYRVHIRGTGFLCCSQRSEHASRRSVYGSIKAARGRSFQAVHLRGMTRLAVALCGGRNVPAFMDTIAYRVRSVAAFSPSTISRNSSGASRITACPVGSDLTNHAESFFNAS
jgi:hypothetical protein